MKPTIYWIAGPWAGRLAIVPRPRGGDWLEDEVRGWRDAGLGNVVSLLTADEEKDLDLTRESDACLASGIDFVSLPIPDRHTPDATEPVRHLVVRLEAKLQGGGNVGVHCRQGIGRSALIAACVLTQAKRTPAEAFAAIEQARGVPVPETAEQRQWLERWSATIRREVE